MKVEIYSIGKQTLKNPLEFLLKAKIFSLKTRENSWVYKKMNDND